MAMHPQPDALSKHRIEALTDGIYAVAMTLLVIELKLPAHELVHSQFDLINGIVQLIPRFIAWIISFFVLALFWLGNHRLFHFVRVVDGRLVGLSILQLGLVSLVPFSSALSGEYTRMLVSQIVYSLNMMAMAVTSILVLRHIHMHPELCTTPVPASTFRATRFRLAGLIVISLVAIGIGMVLRAAGNAAFMLMMIIGPVSRRIEARGE